MRQKLAGRMSDDTKQKSSFFEKGWRQLALERPGFSSDKPISTPQIFFCRPNP